MLEAAYAMTNFRLSEHEDDGLEATDNRNPPLATMANAVHVAAVAVDRYDGTIAIERNQVVHDCSRIISPTALAGRVHGTTTQGSARR